MRACVRVRAALNAPCTRSPSERSRKNGGQRASAEAAPTVQTSDRRRFNYPPDPGARSMESEKSGGGRG